MSNSKEFGTSIKDYAEQRGKTVQAVYQQMKRQENARALNGHIFTHKVGNKDVKFLDEEAIRILDEGSGSTPNIMLKDGLKEQLELKEQERKKWEAQAYKLQGKIELLREMLAEKDSELHRLEEPKRQIDDLKAQNADLSAENERIDKETKEAIEKAQEAVNTLSGIYEKEKEYSEALEKWTNLSWLKRRRTPKPTRNKE